MDDKNFQMTFPAPIHDQTCTSLRHRGSLALKQTRLLARNWFLADLLSIHFIVWEDPK
jgi:hypothetical protein